MEARDEYNATLESAFTVTLLDDIHEDTDGDGFTDAEEISAGSDPRNRYSKPGLDFGLVAWYPLDGNASDMSGNGNDGTVFGATLTDDRNGEAYKAYRFDGYNDSIKIGKNALHGRDDFSFSSWINFTAKSFASGNILSAGNYFQSNELTIGRIYQDFKIYFKGERLTGFNLSGWAGNWKHLVITRSFANKLSLYVDGHHFQDLFPSNTGVLAVDANKLWLGTQSFRIAVHHRFVLSLSHLILTKIKPFSKGYLVSWAFIARTNSCHIAHGKSSRFHPDHFQIDRGAELNDMHPLI